MNVQCMRLYDHLTKLCAHDHNKGVEGDGLTKWHFSLK